MNLIVSFSYLKEEFSFSKLVNLLWSILHFTSVTSGAFVVLLLTAFLEHSIIYGIQWVRSIINLFFEFM